MALATQCPHCHTKFRVAADQLKLRGGIVRCGACQSIFDGNAHLVALDSVGRKDDAPAPPTSPPTSPPSAPITEPAAPDGGADTVFTLGADGLDDDEAVAPVVDLAPDEELVAQPLLDDAPAFDAEPAFEPEPVLDSAPEPVPEPVPHEPGGSPDDDRPGASDSIPAVPTIAERPAHDPTSFAALPMRASAASEPSMTGAASGLPAAASGSKRAKAMDARTRRSKLTPTRIDAPKLRVPDSDEPEFVKRSRRQEQAGRTQRILMGAGAGVLLLALAAQGAVTGRAVLAARYPAVKPLLSALCAGLGCRVGLPTQVETLAIETGELSPLGPGTYSLNTLLRNQGSLVQAWPSIELELVDDNNKPLLRRVFGPGDYLPAAAVASAGVTSGFAARSEQPVRIDFALAGLTPAGYHLFVFYP